MESITDKQIKYIYDVLGEKYQIYIEDIKSLTKKEASGIIKRNIKEKRPLLQWYCGAYADGKEYFKKGISGKNNKDMVSDRYYLNKRLLEKNTGKKVSYYSLEYDLNTKKDLA